MAVDRSSLDLAVEQLRPVLVSIAERLHDAPELAYQELRAVRWLAEAIESEGLTVERELGGLPTAFRARVGSGGPRVAILAEYDALPEIGHACGHNLIAAGALGAFLAIATRCARGAALACGVEVEIDEMVGYKSMRNNLTLARRFGESLAALGRPAPEGDASVGAGSTDMGDVSHAVPSIHPYLAICEKGHALCHQHAFAACSRSQRGHDTAAMAAKAMARTALDLLEDEGLLERVRAEFVAA